MSIIKFYAGDSADDRGRYLRDILKWPDERLESTHDYIQWLFPLREASGFNPHAPTLDDAIIREFKTRSELQNNMRRALVRMLDFYGLRLDSGKRLKGVAAKEFDHKRRNWLTYANHNHLRITRILKSTSLLGLGPEAQALLHCLTNIHEAERERATPGISEETFEFWQKAVLE